jgi:hypothetical protein
MNYSIENARKYLNQAREIKSTSASKYRELHKQVQSELGKIQLDRDLTNEAKLRKATEHRKARTFDVMGQAHLMRQEYDAQMQKAQKIADQVFHAPKPQPSEELLGRFTRSFNTLKTELMLSTNPKAAVEKLELFIRGIDDPYMADIVRNEFSSIAATVVNGAGTDTTRYKLELSKMFEALESNFETPEVKVAREILEEVEASSHRRLFPLAVEEAAKEMFGHDGDFINNTGGFYTKYPDEKQPEFKDPEFAEEKVEKKVVDQEWVDFNAKMKQFDEQRAKAAAEIEELMKR